MADIHVTLYTGPDTDELKAARLFLAKRKVRYEEKNVVHDPGARGELLHQTGGADTPSINVEGHVVVGFRPERWAHLLEAPRTRGQELS